MNQRFIKYYDLMIKKKKCELEKNDDNRKVVIKRVRKIR